jgi:lipopolysaccharide export system protein LptA
MRRRLERAYLVSILCLLAPVGAHGLSTDGDQPIYVEADFADMNRGRGITVYRGKVVISQGSRRLWGDIVHIYTDSNDEVEKVVAVGQPARIRQRQDGHEDCMWGEGLRIEYYTDTETLYFFDDAKIWQGLDMMSSEEIVYDAKNDQLIGGEKGTSRKRVQIRKMPKRDAEAPTAGEAASVDPFSCEQPPTPPP